MLDLTNEKYGRLLVVSEAERAKPNSQGCRQRMWSCVCECGKDVVVRQGHLRAGATTSCGCYHREKHTVHGKWGCGAYVTWDSMKRRCQNPNFHQYRHYGGRGIKVCQRWQSFEHFYEDMGKRPEGMSLERIDNDKGYSPGNCRWADRKTQARNTRRNRNITVNGKTKCVAEWAEGLGLKADTVYGRLNRGWSGVRALGLEA